MKTPVLLSAGLLTVALAHPAAALNDPVETDLLVLDDFADGNDDGWLRYESGGLAPAAYSFPGGDALRIETFDALSTAGIYRPEIDVGRPIRAEATFTATAGISQLVGVLACSDVLSTTGPLDGYIIGLEDGAVQSTGVWRIDGGVATPVFTNPGTFDLSRGIRVEAGFLAGNTVIEGRFVYADNGDELGGFGFTEGTYLDGLAGVAARGGSAGSGADVTVDDVKVGVDLRIADTFNAGEQGTFWQAYGSAFINASNGEPVLIDNVASKGGNVVSARLGDTPSACFRASATFFSIGAEGFGLSMMDADLNPQNVTFSEAGPSNALTVRYQNTTFGGETLAVLVNLTLVHSIPLPSPLGTVAKLELEVVDGQLLTSLNGSVTLPPVDLASFGWTPRRLRADIGASGINSFVVVNAFEAELYDVSPRLLSLDIGEAFGGIKGNTIDLRGVGFGVAGEPFQLIAGDLPASQPAMLFVGASRIDAPFKGGVLVPAPDLSVPLVSDGVGDIVLPTSWPAGVPAGVSVYAQIWAPSPFSPSGLGASNAVELRTF